MAMTEREALEVFKALVRIPSVTATEGEEQICAYLEEVLRSHGIPTERIARVPERPNLLAEVRAEHPTEPPLTLISHIDVVPVDESRWTHAPFGADTDGGRIWGRGTVDTKHLTAMELYTFLLLADRRSELNRDIRFLATIDEEQGSAYGMGYVREARPELFDHTDVINEGGGFPLHIAGKDYLTLTCGEKAVCKVRVWADGQAGHASAPTENQAVLRLAEALKNIFSRVSELNLGSRETYDAMVRAVGEQWDNATAADIHDYAGQNAITMRNYQIGVKSNVLPARAEAVLDFRVLPYSDWSQIEDYVRRCLEGPGAGYEVLTREDGFENNRGNSDVEAWTSALTEACRRHGLSADVMPMLALGRTDGRFFAGTGSAVYGCSPLLMGDSFDVVLPKVHGDDENILEESFLFGCRVLSDAAQARCLTAGR